MATVFVTDGEQRSALAIVRSLGNAGHRVHVGASRRTCLAGASRHAAACHLLPDPLGASDVYLSALATVTRETRTEILLPVTDAAMLAVLGARHGLENVRIPFSGIDAYRALSDKSRAVEEARALGVRTPAQHLLRTRDDAEGALPAGLRFPIVVKPARSVVRVGRSSVNAGAPGGVAVGAPAGARTRAAAGAMSPAVVGSEAPDTGLDGAGAQVAKALVAAAPETSRRVKVSVKHAASRGELRRHLDAFPDDAYPLLLQERIVGPGIGIFLLLHEGRVLASFAHRRIREKPPSGGVSVYREAVEPDPELVDSSVRLLASSGWSGVAMVEYKRDAESGEAYLMEVNARFWGSLQLAIDAGVDFPALLVSATLGDVPEAVPGYRVGTRSRWWWGDVDQLLARLRRSRSQLSLPPDVPGRARAIADFLHTPRTPSRKEKGNGLWGHGARARHRSEVFRMDDPLPFLRETVDWVRGR